MRQVQVIWPSERESAGIIVAACERSDITLPSMLDVQVLGNLSIGRERVRIVLDARFHEYTGIKKEKRPGDGTRALFVGVGDSCTRMVGSVTVPSDNRMTLFATVSMGM